MKTLREFANWLKEQELNPNRGKFSVEKLKKIGKKEPTQETLNEIINYLETTLGRANSHGSFRYVWMLNDTQVLKVVKGVDRIEQNEQEKRNSECLGSEYAIQVFDYHPRFYWLIEERVNPLNEAGFINQFNNKAGTSFGERMKLDSGMDIDTVLGITFVISYLVTNNTRRLANYKTIADTLLKSEWFRGLLEKLKGCQVSSNDFHQENWGIRPSTGELVILDLGF